jgi:heterodisulfide reductase subunit B
MRYAYYPGCSLHSTGSEFDNSLRAIAPRLGVELDEVKGWICCGSTPAHSVSELLALALPVANLGLVEQMEADEVMVPCASCFRRLKSGHLETTTRPEVAARVNRVVDEPYRGTVKVSHPLEIFSDRDMLAKIAEKATADLSHLRVVCYYGCLLTRPPKVMQFDRHEYPMSMDAVLRSAGIATLDWDFKTTSSTSSRRRSSTKRSRSAPTPSRWPARCATQISTPGRVRSRRGRRRSTVCLSSTLPS